MQREAGAVSPWQHPGCLLWPVWAPALPTKCLHRQLVPRSPCQPLCTPMLGEWGSRDRAAFTHHSWSMGSLSHYGGVPAAMGQ